MICCLLNQHLATLHSLHTSEFDTVGIYHSFDRASASLTHLLSDNRSQLQMLCFQPAIDITQESVC